MSFGSAKKAKAPKPLAPAPQATMLDEDTLQRDRDRRRQRIVAAGRQSTILTGGLGAPSRMTNSLLGG